jgi:hypothetical protein
MPQYENVVLVYEEFDGGSPVKVMGQSLRSFAPGERGGWLPCGNPLCYRGGYDIGPMALMIGADRSEMEVALRCDGDEGSPRGRQLGESCLRSIKGTLRIEPRVDR